VPWWWIADESRRAYKYVGHRSVREGLLDSLDSVHLNPWGDAKGPVVLCESRSLAGVLDSVAEEYGCTIASTNGQCGGFLHTNVVPLLDGGRPVLYLGDLDSPATKSKPTPARCCPAPGVGTTSGST
jgi:hypothetical protein